MLLNLLINYYVLKELIYVKISTRQYNLNCNTKMPDLTTLCNYGKKLYSEYYGSIFNKNPKQILRQR